MLRGEIPVPCERSDRIPSIWIAFRHDAPSFNEIFQGHTTNIAQTGAALGLDPQFPIPSAPEGSLEPPGVLRATNLENHRHSSSSATERAQIGAQERQRLGAYGLGGRGPAPRSPAAPVLGPPWFTRGRPGEVIVESLGRGVARRPPSPPPSAAARRGQPAAAPAGLPARPVRAPLHAVPRAREVPAAHSLPPGRLLHHLHAALRCLKWLPGVPHHVPGAQVWGMGRRGTGLGAGRWARSLGDGQLPRVWLPASPARAGSPGLTGAPPSGQALTAELAPGQELRSRGLGWEVPA